ncbi:MAG: Soluble lytic murein transglycosylase precursor (EC [uncultured Thiotrichaceae bacterium]|uniref:Soluble lytic murein transglycosylase (EC) n=1 Tax=uncultured Thiotrichaceae bacterium TaxID=298394 RepID=A0A6S6S9L9_9GAMM|nr:MAG: Soluble lytic murein transglycosylase precursor (EC [uncultured Thiotrichaceae bacterium]
MTNAYIISGLITLCSMTLPITASAKDLQDTLFERTYTSVSKGVNTPIRAFKDHPLYPYLEYEKLLRQKTSEKKLQEFVQQYEPSLVADRAWRKWIHFLAKNQRWETIIREYQAKRASTSVKCHYYEAHINAGNKDLAFEEAKALWLSPKSLPKKCNSLFSHLKKDVIQKDDYWERIQLAASKGNISFARTLVKHLPDDEQNIARQYLAAHQNPKNALRSKHVGKGTYSRKVIGYAIKRIARKNYQSGYKTWRKYATSHPFTEEEKGDIESYLGVRAAFNHDADALNKLARIPAIHRSDDASVWMARMALRQGQWEQLQNALNSMHHDTQKRDIWRYWQAKTHDKLGNESEAMLGYADLAKNATFYGFLAADHLGVDYSVLNQEPKDWKQAARKIKQTPGLKRASHWYNMGRDGMGNREWLWTIKHLNKDDQLAAAALALELEKPLLAVQTVAKTKDWNQVDLRFPVLYNKLVKELSSENKVNPAWVYGVMRRESAFNTTARSGANAHGLMQLLPSTARDVGRKLGISRVSKSDLKSPRLNIQLGSAYLKSMLDNFDGSYVKATAGYNAGPSRSVKWTPKSAIDADRWVESIPFTETRKYVRAVMAYTTIYDHKLTKGRGQRISDRLSPVGKRLVN